MKTTAAAHAAINRHSELVEHFAKQQQINAEFFSKLTLEQVNQRTAGMEAIVEAVLREEGCYYGFTYIDYDGNATIDEVHPWMIRYYTQS